MKYIINLKATQVLFAAHEEGSGEDNCALRNSFTACTV